MCINLDKGCYGSAREYQEEQHPKREANLKINLENVFSVEGNTQKDQEIV